MRSAVDWIATVQGVYFALTGIWPLVHMPSFLAVTGDKTDKWLVRTVGAIVLVIGGVLIVAGARSAVDLEVVLLAAGGAIALGLVDVIYVSIGRIPKIYLADAVVEGVLLLGWALAWMNR